MACLTLDSKFLDTSLNNIETFVTEIFSGHDQDQKLKVLKKLKDLTKLYRLAKPPVVKNMLGKFALVNKRFNSLTKDLSLFKTFHLNGLSDNSKIDLVPVYRNLLMKSKKLMKKLSARSTSAS